MADPRRLELETRAAARLKEQLVEAYGDDAEVIRDTLEGATNLHEMMKAATFELADVEGAKEGKEIAIAKMKERLSRDCRKAEAIREAIFNAMEVAELTSLKTPAATLSVRASPPRVEITDEAAIPPVFKVQPPPTIDKKGISAALKAGEVVPGAVLSNSPPALSVRLGL